MMDFEKAMWQACSSVLPSCRLRGCLFHWNQAVWRKVQDIGLRSEYTNDPAVKKVIRRLFGLPFLPASDIRHTFWLLSLTAFSGKLVELFSYVHDTWMQMQGGMWKPEHWSAFKEDIRTNNDVEGWHHRFNSRALKGNLPFYALVRMLHEESRLTLMYQGFSEAGKFPAYKKTRYLQMDIRLRHHWAEFDANEITSMELLRRCSQVYCPNFS